MVKGSSNNSHSEISEAENREVKSQFGGSQREWLRIIKTITAMSNTRGGALRIERLKVNRDEFDSARLDSRINSFVDPRIDDIRTELDVTESGVHFDVLVHIEDSPAKPHVIKVEGQYQDHLKRHHFEFYAGQIWVRHSASNAPATADDLDRILRSRSAALLTQLGSLVLETPSLDIIDEVSNTGLSVNISDGAPAQMSLLYQYTPMSLGLALGKSTAWISKAVNALGWRSEGGEIDSRYVQPIPSAKGDYVVQWRFSSRAMRELQNLIERTPSFDPYDLHAN